MVGDERQSFFNACQSSKRALAKVIVSCQGQPAEDRTCGLWIQSSVHYPLRYAGFSYFCIIVYTVIYVNIISFFRYCHMSILTIATGISYPNHSFCVHCIPRTGARKPSLQVIDNFPT